jgi:hypothetical protein
MPHYDVLASMLNGQPIKAAPLYDPLPGPSTQNVKNTAYSSEGLFKEGTFEKVIYRNPNGTVRDTPYTINPEDIPVYKGPDFVPTVRASLQGETITPEGGICMPPRLMNGFEIALAGRMAEMTAKPIQGPARDEVFDVMNEYRDVMKQANYNKKLEHLLEQGFEKNEIDEALAQKRKEHLMTEIAKPTPVAPKTIQNSLDTMMKRDFTRPAEARFVSATGTELSAAERSAIVRGPPKPAVGFGNVMTLAGLAR